MNKKNYQLMNNNELMHEFNSSYDGLGLEEVQKRLIRDGKNERNGD